MEIWPRESKFSAEIEIEEASQLEAFLAAEEKTIELSRIHYSTQVQTCSSAQVQSTRASSITSCVLDVLWQENSMTVNCEQPRGDRLRIIEHLNDLSAEDIGTAGRLVAERKAQLIESRINSA